MRKQLFLVLALLLSLLAACGQEQITADEIVRRVQETIQNTNDLHGVVALSLQSPERSGNATVELWLKRTGVDPDGHPTGKLRLEVQQASESKLQGVTVVSDGEQAWAHVPAENKVYTGKLDELKALHGEGDGAATDPLAATEQLRDIVERGLEAFNVEVLGNEEVAGHPAYKVKLTPKQDTQEQLHIGQLLSITAWIDQNRWLPLKVVADAGALGKAEIAATLLETNTGINDDLFTFTPPEGAEIIDVVEKIKASRPQAVTFEEARQSVDFELLEPANLPTGVKLVTVQLVNSRRGGPLVAQVYSGEGIEFSLIQSRGDMAEHDERGSLDTRRAQGREVQVRGATGYLVESQGGRGRTLLTWEEQGVDRAIAGRLSGEQALEIAEGLK